MSMQAPAFCLFPMRAFCLYPGIAVWRRSVGRRCFSSGWDSFDRRTFKNQMGFHNWGEGAPSIILPLSVSHNP